MRSALLQRLTASDLYWLDVPLRGGFKIKVCSPVCIKVSRQDLEPVARYIEGGVPADGMYIYVPVNANESSEFARRWRVFPLTRAVSDQAHNTAVYAQKPAWPPSPVRMYDFVGYSQKLRRLYFSYQGWALVSGSHKLWVLSAKGPVVNHGFQSLIAYCKTIPRLACVPGPVLDRRYAAIQNIGAAHNATHWDYSQMIQFMKDLKDPNGQRVDLRDALLRGNPAVWDEHPATLKEAAVNGLGEAIESPVSYFNGLGWLGQQPALPQPLVNLVPLSTPQTQPTVANAMNVVRLIAQFQGIPWRVPFVVLEHEGGVRLFGHNDGVMQTTDVAKPHAIRAMPRALKLVITGRPANDAIADNPLNAAVRAEFPRRLAVQIACGVQELKNGLARFADYVALALIAYNAGSGSASRVVTRGAASSRPRGTADDMWETMCRFAASLYHQLPGEVRIATGQWQCDANIPAWFRRFAVFDRHSGLQLIAYQYLRSIRACIRPQRPAVSCTRAVHGGSHRQDGSGNPVCDPTRPGALDKFYNPTQLSRPYRDALAGVLGAIPEDNLPIKVVNGRMVKLPLASGPVSPQGSPFDGPGPYGEAAG